MKCINDFVEPGEILIIQIPHQSKPKIASFNDIDEALNAYSDKYVSYPSLSKQIKNGDIDFDLLEDIRDEIYNEYGEIFDTDTPYYQTNSEYYFLDKEELLSFLVKDDMHEGHLFIAKENETYKEFIDRVFKSTRGHNEPSYSSILSKFYLEDNRFDLNKIAEENEWVIKDVKRFGKDKKLLIGDFVFELDYNENRNKDFVNNFKQSLPKPYVLKELQKWNENQEEITFCYRHSSQPDNFIVKDLNELAKQYPYGAMGHVASAFYNKDKSHLSSATLDFIEEQIDLMQIYDVSVSKPLYSCKDFYDDLEKNLKESFPHNYEAKNVGEEFIREVSFLFHKNSSLISSKDLAAKALHNVLLYEKDNKNIHNETKNDLLSNFFKTQRITNEKEFVSFVEKIIEITKAESLAIQKQIEANKKIRETAEAKQQSHDNALNEAKELLESGTIKESKIYSELQEKLDSTPSKKAGNYRKRKQKLLVKTFMEHLSKTSKNKLLPEVEAKYFKDLEKPNYER